ncbi:MAG: MXAN_2562 family outer membrane beta-barrel protein, partial [Myxococcota bacterium]|nr:MXAN_2562 family outer membrane beta-barrel protein [Myxococcota bacterium]
TALEGGSGDSAIPLDWDAPAGEVDEYRIYVAPGDCPGSMLTPGGRPPGRPAHTVSGSTTSASLSGAALGLPVGGSAAVAVTAVDDAGNESALSNVACLRRVQTDGFCARHVAMGGRCESCAVSAPGAGSGSGQGAWIALGLAALVLVPWRRARRPMRHAERAPRLRSRASTPGVVLVALVATVSVADGAAAQSYWDDQDHGRRSIGSPERFAIELRLGTYEPDVGTGAFQETFGDDDGPLLALELDALPLRLPHVGLLGVGLGAGWTLYTGRGFESGSSNRVSERATLYLLAFPVLGVLRVDGLAREVGIPLLLVGKIGLDAIYWSSSVGERDEASGWSTGLRWAVQIGLDLDFFDRAAARALDEEWGINHTFLFFELFGSSAGGGLPLGPDGGLAWSAGLGATF